jgi:hypothetical protein
MSSLYQYLGRSSGKRVRFLSVRALRTSTFTGMSGKLVRMPESVKVTERCTVSLCRGIVLPRRKD